MHSTLFPLFAAPALFLSPSTSNGALSAVDDPEAVPIELAVNHEKGQVFVGSMAVSQTSELVEVSASQNGEEQPVGDIEENLEQTYSFSFEETVTDAKDSELLGVGRVYSDVEGKLAFEVTSFENEGELDSDEIEFESPLEGESVTFKKEGGEFSANASEDSELEDEVLGGLNPDLSLSFLLPEEEGALEVGDSWKVSEEEILQILDLPGNLLLADENGVVMDPAGMGSQQDFEEDGAEVESENEGELELTYEKMVDVDGRLVAEISLKGGMKQTLNATAEVEVDSDEGGASQAMDVSLAMSYEIEGVLHWDVEAKAFVWLSFEAVTADEGDSNITFDVPGVGEFEMEQSEVSAGEITIEFSRRPKE